MPKLFLAAASIASTGRVAVVLQPALDAHDAPSADVNRVRADRDFANRKSIAVRHSDRMPVDYVLYDTVGFGSWNWRSASPCRR